jgi:ABC-type Fe3+-siderophore transport system permease subunit
MIYFLVYLAGVFITFAVFFFLFYKKSLQSISLEDELGTSFGIATFYAVFWPILVPIVIIANIIVKFVN